MKTPQKQSSTPAKNRQEFNRRNILAGLGAGMLAGGVANQTFFNPTEAYAAELSLTELETRIDRLAVYASPERFPGMDPTGATSSSAAIKTAMKAVPDGGTLIIPPGEYLVDSIISIGKFNITIYGYGAKLVQSAKGFSIISLAQKFSPVKASAVTTYSTTGNNPQNTTASDAATFTTATPTGWKAGEIIKIISDDPNVDARPAATGLASRSGEFAVVASTAGTTVKLVGMLRANYTTNVRVSVMPKDTIRIYGLEVATTDAGLETPGGYGALISITGLYKPILKDIRCAQAGNQLIQFTSCYGYIVDNLDAGYAVNKAEIDPAQLGYGIMDNCSSYGLIQNSILRYVRHAYTDDTPRITAGDDSKFHQYGKTYGTKVVNSHALGSSGVSWDTHHCSENVTFHGCSASHGGAGAAGFQLRGKGHSVIDCQSINMSIGLAVINEPNGGESYGHVANNMYVKDASKTAVAVSIHPKGHPAAAGVRDTKRNLTINGLYVDNAPTLFGVINSKVKASQVDYILPEGTDASSYVAVKNQNSDFSLYDSELDYTQNVKGKLEFFTALSAPDAVSPKNAVLAVKNVKLSMSDQVATRVERVVSGPAHIITARDVELSHALKYMMGDYEAGSSFKWSVTPQNSVANSDTNSGFHTFTDSAIAKDLKNVWSSYDRDITVELNNKQKTVTVLAPFPAGKIRGSILRFWVSGVQPVTVKHGSVVLNKVTTNYRTQTLLKKDKVMAVGTVTSFLWNGTAWIEIN